MARTYIGTSGWQYDDWLGPFYPEASGKGDLLKYYAKTFGAVEINNTFYNLPERSTLKKWREATPDDFIFACKASRYTTHMKKLKDPKASTEKFFRAVDALAGKLGPILFQLPPKWRVDARRLEEFLEAVPPEYRYTFEFRDPSWFCDEVYKLLTGRDAAFCIYNMGETVSPIEVTASFVYIRLHGPDEKYQGSYDDRTLNGWARRIRNWNADGKDVYCFFDNDQNANAPNNAQRLKDML